MGKVEKIGVGGLAFDLVEALDVAFEPLLEQSESVTVLGSVTAAGPRMRKAMFRNGFAVLVDDRVEIWHREAVLGRVEGSSLVTVALEDVCGARIRRRSAALDVRLLDVEEEEILRLSCTGGETATDPTESAIRTWLSGGGIDAELVESATLGERKEATVRRVRDQTKEVVGTFTLEEYRRVMDQAMEQVVEVLTVQSAELQELQRRVIELEQRGGDGSEAEVVG